MLKSWIMNVIQADTLSTKEILKLIKHWLSADIASAKSSNNTLFIKGNPTLISSIYAKNIKGVYISEYSLATHKKHGLKASEYYKIALSICYDVKPAFYKPSNKPLHYKFYYELSKRAYKVIIKLSIKDEIFILSVMKSQSAQRELRNLIKGALLEP